MTGAGLGPEHRVDAAGDDLLAEEVVQVELGVAYVVVALEDPAVVSITSTIDSSPITFICW